MSLPPSPVALRDVGNVDDTNSIYANALLHRLFGAEMKYPEITKAMNAVR